MTNKEAIVWIERLSGEIADKLKIDKMKLTDYINLQEYVFNYEESLKMAMEALKETEWIPTEERLPVTDKYRTNFIVTVTCDVWKEEKTLIAEWENTTVRGKKISRWIWNDRLFPKEWEIIAWKPMPKCWKEVGK